MFLLLAGRATAFEYSRIAEAPLDIPFMAHWEPYAPERDFPRFHSLHSAWPDQIFLLPHMGFASADQLEELMSQHPNLYLLTSKKERYMGDFADPKKQKAIGPSMLDGDVLRPEWKEFLIRYPDRILFASDPHIPKLWQKYGKVIRNQRLILGQLPRAAAEKIAYKNAEKMYGEKSIRNASSTKKGCRQNDGSLLAVMCEYS